MVYNTSVNCLINTLKNATKLLLKCYKILRVQGLESLVNNFNKDFRKSYKTLVKML